MSFCCRGKAGVPRGARVCRPGDGDPHFPPLPLHAQRNREPRCRGRARHGVRATAAQPGTGFGAGALYCWVFFAGEVMQSHAGMPEPAGGVRMKENVLGGLPGWEKGTLSGETGERADFRSQRFPAARCSAASARVRRCRRSRQPADGSPVFPTERGWRLPFRSRANRQRRRCSRLGWGKRNLARRLFFLPLPPAAGATYLQTAVRGAEIISWKDQMR